MKLSIIIPVFNEEKSITQVLQRVINLHLPQIAKEIIVVNDGSTDKTGVKIKDIRLKNKFIYSEHKKNQGKGVAVKTGISHATGEYIVIQDADLEYNPADISRLIKFADMQHAVYGTRLRRLPHLSNEERRVSFFIQYIGNRFLSLVTSVLYGQWITDMETCYKLFPRAAVEGITLHARGFELEPELTAKLMKAGLKIIEVPITTKPRGYEEGKKLNALRDGPIALWNLIKYRFVN